MADAKGGGYTANDWFDLTKPVGALSYSGTSIPEGLLFTGHTGITKMEIKNVTVIPDNFCKNCSALEEVELNANLTKINVAAFYGTSNLKQPIFVPRAEIATASFEASGITAIVCKGVISSQSYALRNCPNLKAVDMVDATHTGSDTFQNSAKLSTLILRNSSVASLSSVNSLSGTPFASGKSGGTLYVPSALIASYQSASYWSTILGYPNNRIEAIEGSIYETQYADGTPIPTGG